MRVSTFTGNEAQDASAGQGGAIIVTVGLTVLASTFVGNRAGDGGSALAGINGFVTNSTFVDNTAGGAAAIYGSGWQLRNLTLLRNTATSGDAPGAVFVVDSVIANTIFGSATDTCEVSGGTFDLGGNLALTGSGCIDPSQSFSKEVANAGDLGLGELALNAPGTTATVAISDGSVAIYYGLGATDGTFVCVDDASPWSVGLLDQRGVSRDALLQTGDPCDSGAYENTSGTASGGGPQPTRLTLAAAPSPSVYGVTVTLTVSVSSGDGTIAVTDGTVSISDGTDPILGCGGLSLDSNGVASCTTGDLSAATHVLTATYGGTADWDPTTGTASHVVSPAPLVVTADSTTRTYGAANPSIGYTVVGFTSGDGWSTEPSCGTDATAGSGVGAWTTSCTTGDAGPNYAISYSDGILTITKATAAVLYTGPLYLSLTTGTSADIRLTGTVSPASCVPLRYTITTMGGTSTDLTASTSPYTSVTTTLAAGIYEIRVWSASSGDCDYGFDSAILSIVTPALSSTGGGWYKPDRTGGIAWGGNPRVNVGYTVQKTTKTIKGSTNLSVAYSGEVLWINKGSWRLKASIRTSTVTTSTGSYSSGDPLPYGTVPCPSDFTAGLPSVNSSTRCGALTGTGILQRWNQALNGGAGGWEPSTYGTVHFTQTMFDGGQLTTCKTTGSGRKQTTTCSTSDMVDWFGIQFLEVPTSAIRESTPVLISGSLRVT